MPQGPISVFNAGEIYTRYRCTLEFNDKIYGGQPRDPKLIEAWVLRNMPEWATKDEVESYVKARLEDVALEKVVQPDAIATLTNEEQALVVADQYASEKHTNGFRRDPDTGRPMIGSYQLKAMLKEAVYVNFPWDKSRKANWKGKSPRDLFVEYVAITPLNVILQTTPAQEPAVDMCIGHIKGKYGRLSTLTYVEYLERARLEFEVLSLDDFIEPDWWARLWTWSERNGLGARRSMGAGTFAVTRWDRIGQVIESRPILQATNGLVREPLAFA